MALADGEWGGHDRTSALQTSLAALVLLAGLPVLAAMWALLSPNLVLSREMTWDFIVSTISPAPGSCATAMSPTSTSTSRWASSISC